MSFLTGQQINDIQSKLVTDEADLKRLYNAKKSEHQYIVALNSLVEHYQNNGWEIEKSFQNKTRLRKIKEHSIKLEDDIWCQFYELGYRCLNRDETFILPFSKNEADTKQIDIIAINDETIFLIECKSSEKLKKAPSYKDELEAFKLRISGFRKSLTQLFGSQKKIKFVFATRNIRFNQDGEDMDRLNTLKIFYYNDNTYQYINSLIKSYKNAALYQFLGLIFKNELINNEKLEIPAVEGWMGNKTYYMFSIEPTLLLKIGFILHRTKANDIEFPTYQRLLVPSRLKGISKFIDNGGYFPNSIIINFSGAKKIIFEPTSICGTTKARIGTLKIPNAYAIAYIIDGQHRLYGYANSTYKASNTIPIVALKNLSAEDQLSIFMDINQNQKAVSPSLRLDLEEFLYWDSDRADSRLKALRSMIIKSLANTPNSPLYNKISVGEDSSLLSFAPFANALLKSGLLPSAKGNTYNENILEAALYNIKNLEHTQEMNKAQKSIVELINKCYELVEEKYPKIFERENYFIVSNRGTYAFIVLIGSLNTFLTEKKIVNYHSSISERFLAMEKYLIALLDGIEALSEEEEKIQLSLLGAGADLKWLRFFQLLINKSFNEYEPIELVDWKERQNDELQSEGRQCGINIEKYMKIFILDNLKKLYGNKWELEIGAIKRECVNRALLEDEKNHKENLDFGKCDWQEMFTINDYKTIIEHHWNKKVDLENFITFEQKFSINIGEGFNSKSEKLKWISIFNSYRNLWAHEGSKGKRLNKEEVTFLKNIHSHFYK